MGRTSDARQRILAAARHLIEQRGYADLGVAEICSAAGVPKGSFYYFFESKEVRAALQSVFGRQADMVRAVVADAVAHGDALVTDPAATARAIVAQLEGQVLLAKLYNDTSHLDTLWTNCLALLGAGTAAAVGD